MRTPPSSSHPKRVLSQVVGAIVLLGFLAPTHVKAAELRDYFVQEAPVADCLKNAERCDPSLVIEKTFILDEAAMLGAGVHLPAGTPVRTWYLGGESEQAKALRSKGGAYKDACIQAQGGCMVLFADAPLSLPDNNELYGQVGHFERLDALDLTRDTPGLVQPLRSGDRKLAISVHGQLDIHGLALRVGLGQLTDGQDGMVLNAKVHAASLDRGELTTALRTRSSPDGKGQWLIQKQDITVGGGRLGTFDMGNLTLRYQGERRWKAAIKTSILGLKKTISGTLNLSKGTFESITLSDSPDAALAQTGLQLECIRGEIRASKQGPSFKGHVSLRGGEGPTGLERWRLNASVRWDTNGLRGTSMTYLNAAKGAEHANFSATSSKSFCTDEGKAFEGKLSQAKMNLSVRFATGWATLQGRLLLPSRGGLLLTHPLEIREGHLFYRGQSELHFPNDFALVGGDRVVQGLAHIELPPSEAEAHIALGWTKLGPTTVGLRVDLNTGDVRTFGADAEKARHAQLRPTPNFANAEPQREKSLRTALLVDDPQVNTLRKAARAPDNEVHASFLDIRDLVSPSGNTVVRIDVRGLPAPAKRLKTAWEMLHAYYTTPNRYDLALGRETASFGQTLYEPPRIVSPYLWGTKALRLQTRGDQLGLMPTAVPSTIWGAWGLRSNLGCAGHYGTLGYFGSETPGQPIAGAEKRAFCWLGTRAHLGSRVDSVFDYPVGETSIGSVATQLGSKWVKRPYKYNMMPGRSLKSCGKDRAPGALDCDPYLVEQGLSCENQQRYVGATRIGSCSPVLHEYRPLVLDNKVAHFDASDKFGTLRPELRDRARSEDGSLKLPAGDNPLIQCPSELTQGALAKSKSLVRCTQPGQFCRAYVDVGNGGVPSLGPAFQCAGGNWQPVGLSPLEAAGFPKACRHGGSWEASITRRGDKFIGTDEARTTVAGQCTLVGASDRFRGVGWGWWGEIKDPYCSTAGKGPKAGKAGGQSLTAALAQRAFQACSYPWHVQAATRDWKHQLAGCDNPQTSLTGPDFGECKFTKTMGVPVRLVAWDKKGTLYQWEPLELQEASDDDMTPRGPQYSRAYTFHGEQEPSAGWSPAAQRVVESAQDCREACDRLEAGCLGYTLRGSSSCWLATRAAFGDRLNPDSLKTSPGASTFLKKEPELFPTAHAGDSRPCGSAMGKKSPCSHRSNHTYVLSPTNQRIGHQPGPLSRADQGERMRLLRDVLEEAPWMIDPKDRNRTGLRVMAIANRRLAASNGDTQALGSRVQLQKDFAIGLSTQPSHLTPSLDVSLRIDAKERTLKAQVKGPADTLKQTHVRFFVDSDGSGYRGHSLGEVAVNAQGQATLAWNGVPVGLEHNAAYHFYALAFHRDASGHRQAPPVLSPYASQTMRASPRLSGRVALGSDGRAGVCHHTASQGETCQSIAFLYGIKPSDLKHRDAPGTSCADANLAKGATLSFAGSCGVQVFIDRNKDGRLQSSEEPSTITDHQGRFAFANPGPSGVQQVTVNIPHGFVSREDFRASFVRYRHHELKGSTLKPKDVPSLEACQALCHPIDPDAQENRHEVRSDFKECGGLLYESLGETPRCTLVITGETKRVISKLKRPGRTNLYVREKQPLRSIHRLLNVGDRPAVLPRVILHRGSL